MVQVFGASPVGGVGVRVVGRLYDCPSLDTASLPGPVMLQNLPRWLPPATCHLSPVTCHLSPVTCHLAR